MSYIRITEFADRPAAPVPFDYLYEFDAWFDKQFIRTIMKPL